MLAASADCDEGVALLLGNGASLELQDALGRCAPSCAACPSVGVRVASALGSPVVPLTEQAPGRASHARRTALMFSAGNNARAALETLLDRGASVSIRDR